MAERRDTEEVCSICINDFKDPKILECQHSFCHKCLEDYVRKAAKNRQFRCPLCRHVITVPEGGVQAFAATPSIAPQCELCEGAVARSRCKECERYLCQTCKTMHGKLPLCMSHVVYELLNLELNPTDPAVTGNPKDVCAVHSSRQADLYCQHCSTAVCWKCFVGGHNGHELIDLHDEVLMKHMRNEVKTLNEDMQKQRQKLETFTGSVATRRYEVAGSVKTACDKIDQQIAKVFEAVTRLGNAVKDDIKKIYVEETASSGAEMDYQQMTKDIPILTRDLDNGITYSASILEDASMVQMLDKLPRVRQMGLDCCSKNLVIPHAPHICFQEAEINPDVLLTQLGMVTEIFGLSFELNQMLMGQKVYSPEFKFAGDKWVVALRRPNNGRVYVDVHTLTRHGDYSYTIKLVNHADDSQALIRRGRGTRGVQLINWNRLIASNSGFLLNNIFTIQVSDIQMEEEIQSVRNKLKK